MLRRPGHTLQALRRTVRVRNSAFQAHRAPHCQSLRHGGGGINSGCHSSHRQGPRSWLNVSTTEARAPVAKISLGTQR